ncbi:hypothetical protein [Robertmurraya sp. P23]
MTSKKQSSNDIKYSIWETRTDEKNSYSGNKQKEAIDLPDPKESK